MGQLLAALRQDVRPAASAGAGANARRAHRPWAELMRRALGFDVLVCSRCSGRMRLVGTIESPGASAPSSPTSARPPTHLRSPQPELRPIAQRWPAPHQAGCVDPTDPADGPRDGKKAFILPIRPEVRCRDAFESSSHVRRRRAPCRVWNLERNGAELARADEDR
jgi:hypothetical protein